MSAQLWRPALSLVLAMTVCLGIVYPLAITAIAMLAFPHEAVGSLVYDGTHLIGSTLIGQSFADPKYFWGRPSATTPQPYNALASSGSNLGPLNPALLEQVRRNRRALLDADPGNSRPLPIDLVTASASGLDPDISVAAAYYQAQRVAAARGLQGADVRALIAAHERGRLLGFLGEQRVNVLELNLALDHAR